MASVMVVVKIVVVVVGVINVGVGDIVGVSVFVVAIVVVSVVAIDVIVVVVDVIVVGCKLLSGAINRPASTCPGSCSKIRGTRIFKSCYFSDGGTTG